MNEQDWTEFLSGQLRTARTWYTMKRECIGCGRPIINVNMSGYCKLCGRHKVNHRLVESTAHQELKKKAVAFLKGIGCEDIKREFSIGDKVKIRVDVLGFRGRKKIAVECGGSLMLKIGKATSLVSDLYILPYGAEVPYLWQPSIKVCHACGHKI